jgi:hypothetical protein
MYALTREAKICKEEDFNKRAKERTRRKEEPMATKKKKAKKKKIKKKKIKRKR